MSTFSITASIKRMFRTALLALFVTSCVGAVSLRAQDQPGPPEAKPPVSSEQKQDSGASAQHSGGTSRQLAHQSKEAAGEEKDEMAEFKQSAAVRGIAKLTGLNLQQSYWLCVLLNFVVIAAILIWAARKNLPGMFRSRSAAIQKAMQEAQAASEEARRRLAEIESRLMKLDVEIAAMRDTAEREGAAEEARIRAAAEEDKLKIVASAEQEIAAAAKAARRQLTEYAADLAVGLARKQIRVDAGTDQALVRNFSQELGASSDDSGKGRN